MVFYKTICNWNQAPCKSLLLNIIYDKAAKTTPYPIAQTSCSIETIDGISVPTYLVKGNVFRLSMVLMGRNWLMVSGKLHENMGSRIKS